MKRHGFSLLEVLAVIAVFTVTASLLFPVFAKARVENKRDSTANCLSNLKQIGLGFKQYIQDYDELYPPHSMKGKGTYGWAEALGPYLKSRQVFHCPKTKSPIGESPREHNYTDYWYNRRISRQNESSMNNSAMIILAGEGNDGTDRTNARYNLRILPDAWRNNLKAPPFRHAGLAHYAFVDGHVKLARHTEISNREDATYRNYTFVPG